MSNESKLLSSNVSKMQGRQRVACLLEIGRDGVIRLYKKHDKSLLFEVSADHVMYSVGKLVKSRIRLSTTVDGNEAGVRLGVWSIDKTNSAPVLTSQFMKSGTKTSARDVWVSTLKKYGATENPQHPEEKLDKIGAWILLGCSVTIAFMIASVILMR